RLVDEGSAGLEPALAASWSYLGTALDRLGRPDEAEQPFRCSLSLRRQLVDAGHGELKPELAASCRALAAHLEVQERPGEAEELLRCGKELLEQRVLERDFLLEPELLDHWLQLVRLQLRLGRFAALEDELHRAAQLLPHLPLLHAAGRAIYRELLAQPDAQLELGGLPREEVLEGAVDFAALLAPFHAGSWPGDLARAEQLADELGRPEQGQALLAAGARLFGAGDPRYHLALAGFCRDRQRPDEAWAAAQQAVAACTDLLQRKEQDPPQLDEDAHASLLWLLLAALRLAARSGLGEEVEPAYRQQRRGELVDQLGRHEQLWHGQGDALRIARSGLLGELEQEGGVRGQPGEELWPLRRGFGPMLGDRWSEVRGELGRTAAQARAGRLEQREAVRLLADLLLRLAETREVRQCLVHWRGSLLAQLHVDLVSECPELRPLPCVLGLVRLLPGEPALPRLAIAGLGGVVEAALLRRLFGPYLTALAQGQAEPIAASGLIAGQLQGEEPSGEPTPSLRVLVEPWARLVSRPAWVDDAESGALARWLVRRYAAAELLREPRLACLDRVAELYGRALDLQAPEPGAGELEELLGLVWSGEPALLPRLYRARFGEGCSRCHRA
ncbi:MAG: tetratricopeptide repeat protein, partial [Deltaproteobacteria bacterium]|nr:tetratricopeptide repeat protein [Deltaproteobacteria bacterium]